MDYEVVKIGEKKLKVSKSERKTKTERRCAIFFRSGMNSLGMVKGK